MNKVVAIIAGEPNSISSEIIFKTWNLKKKHKIKSFFIIGSFNLLSKQKKQLKFKTKIKKINKNFTINDLNGGAIPIYDVSYNQKKPYEKLSTKSNKYIFNCFDLALKLIREKKIYGLINCPVAKEYLFQHKHQGVTEYLSKKFSNKKNEVMLIYNKKLSVSPITTHVSIDRVSKLINKHKIVSKIKTINNFYKKKLKKKPIFIVLGLNPHNYSFNNKKDKNKAISNAVKSLLKSNINAIGPVSPDSSFSLIKKNKVNIIIGMYHDQVLTTFKTLYKFDAINITLGLPFIRISPDHGIGENIVKKKIANPESLIESIKFFNHIK